MTLDDYGSETTWTIKRLGTVIYEGGPYEDDLNGEQIVIDMCLEEGCYIVTMNDSYGDGLCCEYGEGSWVVYDDDNNVMVESDGIFEEQETDQFCTAWSSIDQTGPKLAIYPNPANNTLIIETPTPDGEFIITDAAGRTMNIAQNNDVRITQLDVSSWSQGIYIFTWFNAEGARSVNQIQVVH